MEWLQSNWMLLLPIIVLAADKIVAVTPTPYDDLILTLGKKLLTATGLLKENDKEEDYK